MHGIADCIHRLRVLPGVVREGNRKYSSVVESDFVEYMAAKKGFCIYCSCKIIGRRRYLGIPGNDQPFRADETIDLLPRNKSLRRFAIHVADLVNIYADDISASSQDYAG